MSASISLSATSSPTVTATGTAIPTTSPVLQPATAPLLWLRSDDLGGRTADECGDAPIDLWPNAAPGADAKGEAKGE